MTVTAAVLYLQGLESHCDDVLVVAATADAIGIYGGSGRVRNSSMTVGTGAGVFIDRQSSDSWVVNNHIDNASTYGIELEGGTGGLNYCVITGNNILDPTTHGIMVQNPSSGSSTGHIIQGNIIHSTGTFTDGVHIAGTNVVNVCVGQDTNQSIGHTGNRVADNGTTTHPAGNQ